MAANQGLFVATISKGFIAAILSSIMNNMPSVMINALDISETNTTGRIREVLIYANIIESNLGPKITPIRFVIHFIMAACTVSKRCKNLME